MATPARAALPSTVLNATPAAVIADTLGGAKLLGRAVHSAGELAELIRAGLPSATIPALARKLALGNLAVAAVLGIPSRTLSRRISEPGRLSPSESDRAARMARLYATAVAMIGNPEKAVEWLRTPNRALGGGRPLDQLDTDPGAGEVEAVLGQIAYGVYS